MHGEIASWESPINPLYNLRVIRERVFLRSMGVQWYGDDARSVGEPGNMACVRTNPAAEKVEPPTTRKEVVTPNKT